MNTGLFVFFLLKVLIALEGARSPHFNISTVQERYKQQYKNKRYNATGLNVFHFNPVTTPNRDEQSLHQEAIKTIRFCFPVMAEDRNHNKPVIWTSRAGYFPRLPRRLHAALSPLRGRPSSAHSKRRGLSCHCSLLGDCTPAPRALWSFRTPGKHRVHISIRLLFHVASLPRHPPPRLRGAFWEQRGAMGYYS